MGEDWLKISAPHCLQNSLASSISASNDEPGKCCDFVDVAEKKLRLFVNETVFVRCCHRDLKNCSIFA